MTTFSYNALTRDGKEIEGLITARTREEVLTRLHGEGYLATNIREIHKDRISSWKISKREIINFSRHLSNLMEGGLSLYKALTILINCYKDRGMKSIIEDITEAVKKGSSLSEGLSNHLEVFPRLLVSMTRIGEASGTLKMSLDRFTTYAERDEDLKNRLGTMMIYPILISIVTIATIFFLMSVVLPRVVLIYKELEQILPLPTRLLIISSTFFGRFWLVGLILILLFIIIINSYLKRKESRIFDLLKLKIPLFGEILKKVVISRFSLTLGTLIHAGVPILEAISITKEQVGNLYISSKLEILYQAVKEGKGIAGPLMDDDLFPDELAQMVAVGEESGKIDELLLKISSIYDREIENSLRRLTALFEPFMVIVVGLIVGFVVVAILLPLFSIKIFLE